MLVSTKYKIESASLNVTLYKKEKSKKAGTRWRAIAYFANIKNALDHLVDLEVNETELKEFREVVKKQEELLRLIRSLETPPEMSQRVPGALKA